jgi:chromate reductase, NAD(P)H dehydrogenase (quinone)
MNAILLGSQLRGSERLRRESRPQSGCADRESSQGLAKSQARERHDRTECRSTEIRNSRDRKSALYNQDLEGENAPAAWVSFRQKIKSADAVLFVTPEYNRSVPGALKNALDVAARPFGKNMWDGIPGAVISVSPGAIGAFGANHALRQSLVFLNVPAMQLPEAYIGGATDLFDAAGKLTNPITRDFLKKFGQSFAKWIEANRRG